MIHKRTDTHTNTHTHASNGNTGKLKLHRSWYDMSPTQSLLGLLFGARLSSEVFTFFCRSGTPIFHFWVPDHNRDGRMSRWKPQQWPAQLVYGVIITHLRCSRVTTYANMSCVIYMRAALCEVLRISFCQIRLKMAHLKILPHLSGTIKFIYALTCLLELTQKGDI